VECGSKNSTNFVLFIFQFDIILKFGIPGGICVALCPVQKFECVSLKKLLRSQDFSQIINLKGFSFEN